MRPLLCVEEEYLVVDPETRRTTPRAEEVVKAASAVLGERVTSEITRFQVEVHTAPAADLAEVAVRLRTARRAVAEAARSCGLAVMASGTPLLGSAVPVPAGARHPRWPQAYGALHDEITVCALHVHVDVHDAEHAVLVGNHMRPWLPVLLALAANSPFYAGRDTGYMSWRPLTWGRWPVAGAPPYFSCYADYERAVGALVAAGALVDPGTIFWDVRPSIRLPTAEIRVADVPLDVEDSLTIVALVRGLVVTALYDVAKGRSGPPIPAEVLRAAYWRAARDGITGMSFDTRLGDLVPAGVMVRRLLDHIRPALTETGDLPFAERGLARLLRRGSGAVRQREVYRRRADLADVVDDLIRATAV